MSIKSRRKNRGRNGKQAALTAAAALTALSCASAALAQVTPPVVWDGGGTPGATGSWTTAANWGWDDPTIAGTGPDDTVPVIADVDPSNNPTKDYQFVQVNDGGTVQIATGDAAVAPFLMLGLVEGQSGHLQISGGSLTVGEMRVGGREALINNFNLWTDNPADYNPIAGGVGTVLQTGGNVFVNDNNTFTPAVDPDPPGAYTADPDPKPVQSLYIGTTGAAHTTTPASGSWTIQNGTLTVGVAGNDAIVIGSGPAATGTFTQSGGTVTSTGFVSVGRSGATATYNMNGGTLNVGSGTLTADQNLRIGDGDPQIATSADTDGNFIHTAGTVIVKNDLSVGRSKGDGSYTITGTLTGSVLEVNNTLEVARGGDGAVVQGTVGGGANGPMVKVGVVNSGTQGLSVGRSFTAGALGTGTYTLNSGIIQIGNATNDYLAVGDGIEGFGTFTMKAGTTVTVTDLVQLGRQNSDKNNAVNMDGGTLSAARIIIGGGNASGKGTWTQTAGAVSGSNNTNIGQGSGGAIGTLDMQGGTWTLTSTTNNQAIIAIGNGANCTGSGIISGGTVSVETSVGVVDVGRNGAVGSLTLSNTGELKTTRLQATNRTAGSATILFQDNSKSTIGTLLLDDVSMTINGGTHTITTATVNADGLLNLNQNQTFTTLNNAAGTTTIGQNGNRVLKATTLTHTGGKIDVKDNKIITASNVSTMRGYVAAARAAGAWSGNGITTSMTDALAVNGMKTTIAVARANDVGKTTFGTLPVTTETLVMYTYNGDANLSGNVDADDYFAIDSHYGKPVTAGQEFISGDFDYDGDVDGDDYLQIDAGFSGQGSPIAPGAPSGGVTAVPEPGTGALIGLAAGALMRRRRRN